jgi:predicted nucleic-acid-binding Zn-ribbon protein
MGKLGAFIAGAKDFIKGMGTSGSCRYQAGGVQVRCTHCQCERFHEREALINTTGATFANLDWLNKSGTALVCENCGLIQWFAKPPETL